MALQDRFPVGPASTRPDELKAFVNEFPPPSSCCEAFRAHNTYRCICEEGMLRMVMAFPGGIWDVYEALDCEVDDFVRPEEC